jgi:hypothetical protein
MALAHCRKQGRELVIMNCEIKEEHPDNARFLRRCEEWFGQEIKTVGNDLYGGSIYTVFETVGYIKGNGGAPCTKLLKKAVRRKHSQPGDAHVLGYTSEEMGRVERFNDQNESVKLWPVLAEMGLSKKQCFQILNDVGIPQPEMYRLGYKNNNCIGCVKGGQGYWNKIRVDFPEHFERMADLEIEIGASINYTDIKKDRSASGKNEKRLIPLRELDPKAGRYSAEIVEDCGMFCGMSARDL